jgi:hypothetical protein
MATTTLSAIAAAITGTLVDIAFVMAMPRC